MSEKSPEEKAEERASLLRQGAGNYANLCGVLAGFVAVIMVLVLTPGFFPRADTNVLSEFVVILFSISSFGYIIIALRFISISARPLRHYKSLESMRTEYAFNQALVLLFTVIFLGGVAVLTFSVGALYMAMTAFIGLFLAAMELIGSWWALAKRPPPKKQNEKRNVRLG